MTSEKLQRNILKIILKHEPTLVALENFYPRIPKGGIVVINGLNYASGCTQALNDYLGLKNLELMTFDFYPNITFFKV